MRPVADELVKIIKLVRRTRRASAELDALGHLATLTESDLGGVAGRRTAVLRRALPILQRFGLRRPLIRDLTTVLTSAEFTRGRVGRELTPVVVAILTRAGISVTPAAPEARGTSRTWRRSDPLREA